MAFDEGRATALEEAKALAESAIRAAAKYRSAHDKLNAEIERKQEIGGRIEEIRVVANEVEVARDLKNKLEEGE